MALIMSIYHAYYLKYDSLSYNMAMPQMVWLQSFIKDGYSAMKLLAASSVGAVTKDEAALVASLPSHLWCSKLNSIFLFFFFHTKPYHFKGITGMVCV